MLDLIPVVEAFLLAFVLTAPFVTWLRPRPLSYALGSTLILASVFLTSCGRAPSFDILGSFFPAWLVCLALSLVLTAGARWLFLRLDIAIAAPALTYPSLMALFTFAIWLAWFQ